MINKIYILQLFISNKLSTFNDSSSMVKTFEAIDDAISFGRNYMRNELQDILYYDELDINDYLDNSGNFIVDKIDEICDYDFKIIVSTSDKRYCLYNKPGTPDSGINISNYYKDIKSIISFIDFKKTGIDLDTDVINALLLTQDMIINVDINGIKVKYDNMGDGTYIMYSPYSYNRTSMYNVNDIVEYDGKLGIIYEISDIRIIHNKLFLKRGYCIDAIGRDECNNIKFYSYDIKDNITDVDLKYADQTSSKYCKWNGILKMLPAIADYFGRDIAKIELALKYFEITGNVRYKDLF